MQSMSVQNSSLLFVSRSLPNVSHRCPLPPGCAPRLQQPSPPPPCPPFKAFLQAEAPQGCMKTTKSFRRKLGLPPTTPPPTFVAVRPLVPRTSQARVSYLGASSTQDPIPPATGSLHSIDPIDPCVHEDSYVPWGGGGGGSASPTVCQPHAAFLTVGGCISPRGSRRNVLPPCHVPCSPPRSPPPPLLPDKRPRSPLPPPDSRTKSMTKNFLECNRRGEGDM